VGFEDLTTLVTQSFILWDMTPSRLNLNGLHRVISQKVKLLQIEKHPQLLILPRKEATAVVVDFAAAEQQQQQLIVVSPLSLS
jgi:hypothetical protein